MTKATRYARTSALPAIAAALALTSTPIFAQQAQPVTPDPATTSSAPADQPAPAPSVTEPAPPAQGTDAAPAAAVTTSDTAGTVSSAKVKTVKAKPASSSAKRAQAAPRPLTRNVSRTASAAPVHAPAATAAAAAAAPAIPVAASPVAPAPKPAAPAAAAKPASTNSDTALELGGGLLALLALGGGAVALSRRRRDEATDEWYDDETSGEVASEDAAFEAPPAARREQELVADQPAILAPPVSAFGWGPRADEPVDEAATNDDDRRPGETWVERAYRGPSANNPSLSLRKRLKRAAFFDKREKAAAEGRAEPVAADAGLPANAIADEERVAA
jgi:hypothetical protein